MKLGSRSFVLRVAIGATLFVGTVLLLLVAQGRFNWAGTRGIPILSALFAEPERERGPLAGARPVELPADDGARGRGDRGESASPSPRQEPAAPAGETRPADALAELERATRVGAPETRGPELVGYRPDSFFRFPSLPAGLTVEDLDAAIRRIKEREIAVESQEKALVAREAALQRRQLDLEDREREIADQMLKVNTLRDDLDRRIERFRSEVVLVRTDETKALREYARQMAELDPRTAAEMVRLYWKTEKERTQIVKVLSVMETTNVARVLAELPASEIKDVLEARFRVVREAKR